jgi:hypothetical protein
VTPIPEHSKPEQSRHNHLQKDQPQTSRQGVPYPHKMAVLTSGGDAPGMNAALRSVVRVAGAADIEVVGVQRAFEGLLFGKFVPLPSRAVANII